MPVITMKYKDSVLEKYPLQVGQNLSIGRHESNDVVIDNLAVSGSHFLQFLLPACHDA